jgi:hypothetical protein
MGRMGRNHEMTRIGEGMIDGVSCIFVTFVVEIKEYELQIFHYNGSVL